MSRISLILVLAIALVSCDSSENGPPDLSGTYEMTGQRSGTVVTFRMELSESGAAIEGDGTLTLEDADSPDAKTYDLTVEGEHEHPSVFLEITTESTGQRTTFDGTVKSKDRAEGTITYPNGVQQETTLRRR